MRFSIITICYNAGENIRSAIESVLGQDYEGVEYMIVDGGSTDGTVDIVKSYGDKISTFVSESDRGLYDALNKGVNLATGEVIGFVHADDMLSGRSVISKVADSFRQSDVEGVYGDLQYVSKADTGRVIRNWVSGEYLSSSLKYGWMPPHPALYLKRSVYNRAKLASGEYFDSGMRIAADYDFMMRVLGRLKIKLAYIPEVLVKMKVGGESNRSLKNIVHKSLEDYRVIRRNNVGGFHTLVCKNFRKVGQFLGNKE